ncbi:hypothetical protein DXG03_001526 [Asterophora parasitica]|uniref:F-box domain-containing protein n=1 Tax=Asterophora parasitica TaxID=117018 RepID=A0A9P7K979_9AGAR|nr:hypothetical protein DXG03_001526 [Asterophora parasitica]
MSYSHDIDNEERLFHFESWEESDMLHFTAPTLASARQRSIALESNPHMSSHDGPSTSGETYETGAPQVVVKGKGVTRPVSIRVPVPAPHDFFDTSASTAPSTSRDSHRSLQTPLTPSSFNHYSSFSDEAQQHLVEPIIQDLGESLQAFGETLWKGKEKEHPPVLPPLTFSPEFHYSPSSSSPLQSPGPSSYASSCGRPLARVTTYPEPHARALGEDRSSVPPPNAEDQNIPPSLKRMLSRRRSLPNLLACSSKRSLAARSMLQIKLKLASSRAPSNLTRKSFFRKPKAPDVSRPELIKSQVVGELVGNSSPNPPDPWRTGLKVDELDATISRFSNLRLDDINSRNPNSFYYIAAPLKHKGRSNSSPFPLSALDIVPVQSTDIFAPLPLVVKRYFDEVLPHELRLHVLQDLIDLHESDHLRAIKDGRWSAAKASSSKNKWVGRDKGIRELVKLSRVSKSWRALVFDGPLWTNLDLRSFPNVPESVVRRLTTTGGQCTKALDISGHAQISAATLLHMADHFCVNSSRNTDSLCYTQLTSINLQGCSSLSTRSLHHLLVRSCALRKLCVKGLAAVTNTTCDILSAYCPELTSLDINRCSNVDAEGIKGLVKSATDRGEYIQLMELRMCGLKNIDDRMMAALGKAMPYLEVLDLSYTRLHNSAVEAFVACDEEEEDAGVETVMVSPRDFGRNSSDMFRRRVTRLRHLSLSSCLLLTDEACSNLSHSVPRLEFLELAGIGADMGDDGLVRLLNKTPHIRRLDLEDAAHITDAVLIAITPSNSSSPTPNSTLPEPGHALEQLNISFAANVTDEALLSLIRGCPRLRHLEADNTRVGSAVLREFVRQCRKRKMSDAKAVVVDCRGVSENTVKDLAASTRPRMGWRAYEARKLAFLDARDGNAEEMKVGQDECDGKRVVVKSFYSWQTVDAVKAVREKRRKARRRSSLSGDEFDEASGRALRWWAPGGRRSPRSGRSSPLNMADMNGDGCRMM